MPWLKYRHNSSARYGDWQYKWLGRRAVSDDEVSSVVEELAAERNWSEHYRGTQYEVISVPPIAVLRQKLESAKDSLKAQRQYVAALEAAIRRKTRKKGAPRRVDRIRRRKK